MSVREMGKCLAAMTGGRGQNEVWADLMSMCAYALAAFRGTCPAEVEGRAAQAFAKYTDAEMEAADRFFGLVADELADRPDQDLLGSLYMGLGLNSSAHGQVFTPYSVCKSMATAAFDRQAASDAIEQSGCVTVHDPACGGGATLIAFANVMSESGIDHRSFAWFDASDINFETAMMCHVQLSLIGCQGVVGVGDSLSGRRAVEVPIASEAWFLGLLRKHENKEKRR